ncbi:MAG: SRPBCC domain-containing protein [Myxococcota bacterium]
MSDKRAIEVEHYYRHPPAAVWRALTTPELHAKWWAPGDVRPIVGHRFELDMGAYGKQPCEVVEVEPERLFKYRFAAGSLDTLLSWTLIPEGEGTRLWMRQEGFDLDSPLGKAAFEGMKPGWPKVLGNLERLLGAPL